LPRCPSASRRRSAAACGGRHAGSTALRPPTRRRTRPRLAPVGLRARSTPRFDRSWGSWGSASCLGDRAAIASGRERSRRRRERHARRSGTSSPRAGARRSASPG
jgi:hypothetical protein